MITCTVTNSSVGSLVINALCVYQMYEGIVHLGHEGEIHVLELIRVVRIMPAHGRRQVQRIELMECQNMERREMKSVEFTSWCLVKE